MTEDKKPGDEPESDSQLGGEGSVRTAPPESEAAPPTPRVPVDPRMRTRRIAVRRDEGRRRLGRGTLALGPLPPGVVAGGASRSPRLCVGPATATGSSA